MKKKILAIPHIGTAFGHFYRLASFLDNYIDTHNIYIVIPEPFIAFCVKYLSPEIQIVPRKIHCSISNPSGIIKNDQYLLLLEENQRIFKNVRPDIVIGDPGIQAAILSTKYSVEWIGIMHGCYLPFPESLHMNKELFNLLKVVWSSLNNQIDKLVSVGTNQIFTSWNDLRKTGKIIIPNSKINEPSTIGKYQDINRIVKPTWNEHSEVDLLITCCSSGTVIPSNEFLTELSNNSNCKVYVAGINSQNRIPNVVFLGNNINYKYLVGENTVVITHGGHGTLQAISKAKKVFMIPSDFDQLYNSIVTSAIKGWEIVFDKNWIEIINSGMLFRREIYWNNLSIETIDGELVIKGFDVYEKERCFNEILVE